MAKAKAAPNPNAAQAADQIKLALRWTVKNRFWLVLGLSALLPVIGYFLGSAKIKDATGKEVAAIKGADGGLSPYMSPGIPNEQWKPIVDEKKEVLTKDVNKAWDKLYAVQAPLLKWPAAVETQFHEWGRKWPENVDLGAVQKVIDDYVNAYEKEVDETYAKVNPWEVESGKGVVVVPDKMVLLRPSTFDPANPPSLSKVWSSQERLWIQGTLLDAISKINGKAKDWDNAVVKQINVMEIGSPVAQDQKSLVEGKTVEITPEIVNPNAPPAPAADATSPTGSEAGRMMMPGMGSSGLSTAVSEDVYLLKTDSTQYTIVPVQLNVLVDQNRLQDFLVGLENSPMAIQVLEIEMLKPVNPVTKPVKGEAPAGMMGMMPGMPGSGGDPRSMMRMMMGNNRGPMPSQPNPGDMARMMSGMYGSGGSAAPAAKKGIDVRNKDREKERKEKEAKRKAALGRAVDTYYNIVEVTVYGQARFYSPPPPPPPVDPTAVASPGEAAPVDAAKTDEAKKAEEKPGEPKADDASKKEEAKPAEAKKDEAKPADAKPADAKKDEAKDEAKPADAKAEPKEEGKPAEPAKAEAKPAEPPKP